MQNNHFSLPTIFVLLFIVSNSVLAAPTQAQSAAKTYTSLISKGDFINACNKYLAKEDLIWIFTRKHFKGYASGGTAMQKQVAALRKKALQLPFASLKKESCQHFTTKFSTIMTLTLGKDFKKLLKNRQTKIIGGVNKNSRWYFVSKVFEPSNSKHLLRQLVVVNKENNTWKISLNSRYRVMFY